MTPLIAVSHENGEEYLSLTPAGMRAAQDGVDGEFESEISVPVLVKYHVDREGRAEMQQVVLQPVPWLEGKLQWQRLPLREEKALEKEMTLEVIKVTRGEL